MRRGTRTTLRKQYRKGVYEVLAHSGSCAADDLSPLAGRVYWLIKLRWLAAAAFIGILATASQIFHVQLRLRELSLIAGLIIVLNVAFLVAYRALRVAEDRTERKARLLTNVQITADLAVLAAIIHYSGGVDNPFAFYFIFHVIVSGALLSPKEAWLQAGIATLLFCGVAVLEYTGLLAHHHLPGVVPADMHRNSLVVMATVAAFASTICLAAFTGISISQLVREKQRESLALIEQLEQAYARLDELGRSKSRYMRRISHELRAPLGAIQNLLAMLEGSLSGQARSDKPDLANRAAKRADQALKLVDQLLVLARSEDARFTVEMRQIYLQRMIGEIVGMLQPRAQSAGITLNVEVPHDLAAVSGDWECLGQLFANLATNAVKYTPKGGQVSIRAVERGDCVVVTVADTGIGIPKEDLPHVFDEFYRCENARQFAEEGTGLGLSIVKSVAEMHRADVRIESEAGCGTTFEVSIPMAGSETARADSARCSN